ncbi:TerC/Alx family metal homeostasis membrane protein [Desulfovibrio litoralis]|uniref:Tellurite resistance protein TerC n=1 Tax=Desulfovibrio litoralis DSM 11393 TaxID=1121455 RepID=A0A1M7SR18_9BACT|nr:TerC/Alx family metal homeostasis membrane protein [Desulfovibrio litoralis]SHN60891.1 tellurite resistance protein TerC [Desulfovibrio litoralis DSM 11393]
MIGHYSWLEILLFVVFVAVALLVDLFAHKKDVHISMKNALSWSVFWVLVSLGFAFYVGVTHGVNDSSLFLAGYLLEKSLSVDNLFVIMAIFTAFSIKDKYQHRVLYYGILGALFLRLIFVALGSSILELFGVYALTVFGIFILWSAWKMWQHMDKDHEEVEDYSNHWSVRIVKRFFPVHNKLVGHDFFVRIDGKLFATPLFVCLVVVEFADIMFAFDSVPAIIAITQEPFLVYTSNIFAILGLRSMYFLLAAAKRYLCHLEKAVIAILVFIGFKMLLSVVGFGHISPTISLIIVIGLLSLGIIGSFTHPKVKKDKEQ